MIEKIHFLLFYFTILVFKQKNKFIYIFCDNFLKIILRTIELSNNKKILVYYCRCKVYPWHLEEKKIPSSCEKYMVKKNEVLNYFSEYD